MPPKVLLPHNVTKDDFEWGQTLGTGSFGRVRVARYKKRADYGSDLPDRLAIKCLKKAALIKMKQVDHINNEKNILLILDHPLTVRCYGSFQDDRYLFLILELVGGGEFFTHLRRQGRFDTESARFYSAQICDIFDYLHSRNIIYRQAKTERGRRRRRHERACLPVSDLKPENMLLDRDGYVKLTNFGFAKVVEFRTDTLCGTPEYIAPEVLLNKGHGKPVDWWTLGILIYEMIVGYPPFVDEDPMGIYQKILAGKIVFPRFFDRDAKSLVKKLLQADLSKRLGNLKGGSQDVKDHRWFGPIHFDDLRNKRLPVKYKPHLKAQTSHDDTPCTERDFQRDMLSADDLSNFEFYPDSEELPPAINPAHDPFKDW
ncbi:unnamed protein product [Vitrella brassicaformis CCMP3155]|uniref:Protein kinase domain-containing protein n=1 Tax=Vitrella brassicaformis (strain CCMP3155) TaxID=1169540 RepID=A0A0G4GRV9_VITBC|nr:unnamed protein product [Vitrella brassicaformis CCMP3155]|eukprot:CEM33360.1 unnamed protein product [Vitrella brassicaformis CCMP3155]